jgi:dTDP-4-amino-4,6-dideoxygalactose transaminase
MSVDALEKKLVAAERDGTVPRIIVTVHFAGQPCEMEQIKALADRYGCRIIEDASHAIGASYLQSRIGACKYSDITIFSFHPVKLITTGEGGAAVTNDETLYERMKLLRSHGITRNGALFESESSDPWYYEQQHLGYNYRMTDIQAALGTSQLARLEAYVERRHMLARQYTKHLKPLNLAPPWQHPSGRSAYHLYVITLTNGDTRRLVYQRLRESGIGVNVHYIPVYFHPYYKALGFDKGLCPNAEHYYERALSIPLFAAMSDEEQDYVIDQLKTALS